MKVSKISCNITPYFKGTDNKQIQKNDDKSEFGTKEILLSLVGLAVIGTAGYYIFRGKTPKSVKPSEKPITIPDKNEQNKTVNIFENTDIESFGINKFYERLKNLKNMVVETVTNNRTKLTYSGIDEAGNELVDCSVFDKDKKLIMRFFRTKNKETGKMSLVKYSADKSFKNSADDFVRDDLSGYKREKIFAQSEFVPFKTEKFSRFEQYIKVFKPNDEVKNYRRYFNQDKAMINLNVDDLKTDDFNYNFQA